MRSPVKNHRLESTRHSRQADEHGGLRLPAYEVAERGGQRSGAGVQAKMVFSSLSPRRTGFPVNRKNKVFPDFFWKFLVKNQFCKNFPYWDFKTSFCWKDLKKSIGESLKNKKKNEQGVQIVWKSWKVMKLNLTWKNHGIWCKKLSGHSGQENVSKN